MKLVSFDRGECLVPVKVNYFTKFSLLRTFFGDTMLAGYPATKLKSEIKFPKDFNVVVLPMVSCVCISIFMKKFQKLPELYRFKVEVGKFCQCDSIESRTGSINFFSR